MLEKRFLLLGVAENQGAADGRMQKTVRNDRIRRSGPDDSPPSTRNGTSHQSAALPQDDIVGSNCPAEHEAPLHCESWGCLKDAS